MTKPKLGDTGVTRGGYPYRVICDDLGPNYPVVAAVDMPEGISVEVFTENGAAKLTDVDGTFDLMPPKRFIKMRVFQWRHIVPRAYVEEHDFCTYQTFADRDEGKWISDVVVIEVKDECS